MARNMYGATSADFTLTSGGRPIPNQTLTLWTARTGGTQITDLTDVYGVATTTVTSAADASITYYGPDNDKSVHWAQAPQGNRFAIRPVDITGEAGPGSGILTTKGDILARNSSADARLAVGADGKLLIADSTQTTGLGWVSIGNLLTANQATLATDTTGWEANTGCTIARSTSVVNDGCNSLEITSTGTGTCIALTSRYADAAPGIRPGEDHTFVLDVMSEAASGAIIGRIAWYTQAGSFISEAPDSGLAYFPNVADEWQTISATVQAPPNAARAAMQVVVYSPPSAGSKFYVSKFGIWPGVGGSWAAPGRTVVAPADTLLVPATIRAVVGDPLQVFKGGVTTQGDMDITRVRFAATAGRDYGRYWEYTPADTDPVTLLVGVSDGYIKHHNGSGPDAGRTAKALPAVVSVTAKTAANPSSLVTVACIGDSLTADGLWVQEAYRRLTQSGGSPAGHGFANFDFVGETACPSLPAAGHFGRSGWTAAQFMQVGSPFWIGGQFTVKGWFDANNAGVGPKHVFVLLGWNGASFNATVDDERLFVEKVLDEYPAAKVTLFGLNMPSPRGGLGAEVEAGSFYGDYARVVSHVARRHRLLQDMAEESGWGGLVRFVPLAPQFDALYNIASTATAVNTRNATTELRGTEGIHPSTEGKMQIADVAYRELVADWS